MRAIYARFPVAALFLLVPLSGCAASYDDRNEYLVEMAQRGVQVNKLLRGQNETISEETCASANRALNDDIPSDRPLGYEPSEDWKQLVEQTFINACVAGEY
ncbi:hypothetical protein [Nocardiopsis composta]|uniref:Lipoprotein n=1 Tax=Nocardiopsis composta TaxID=157465 RepID=A0A7W8QNE8_9ACTN|nr:hypothetical protein [Nocardiopsis composta]MBB5433516.1 hypothetical protein [Nocardiopsis composta]